MEGKIKIGDAWCALMHYPSVRPGDHPEELYQAFLRIGREELAFRSKKRKTIEEIVKLIIRMKPGLRVLRDEVVNTGRMEEYILLYDKMFMSIFRLSRITL